MARKFNDEEAFARYVALGEQRSMYKVAREFGVTRRSVSKASKRGNWLARITEIERAAREQSDKRMAETLAQTRERHLTMLRFVQASALKTLKEHPMDEGSQGVKALDMAIKLERTILGEPSETTGMTIQSVTRRELETLIEFDDGEPDET